MTPDILVIIPARGGSKGVPGKNIKPLCGRPLIHYTIDAARAIAPDADIYLSTDSDEIAASAREASQTFNSSTLELKAGRTV